MRKIKQKIARTGVSIRWKLILYFAIFVAVALLVMWVFQVCLLNNFYEWIKRREMADSATELATYVEDDSLDLQAYDQAIDGVMAVAIYRMNRGTPTQQIVSVDATGQTTGITLPIEQLEKYYQKAAQNKGSYTGNFTFGGIEVPQKAFPIFQFKQSAYPSVRLMHMQLAQGESGSVYLILLNAARQPLSTTVQILQTQFLWILSILLVCAAVMVFYLYRHMLFLNHCVVLQ